MKRRTGKLLALLTALAMVLSMTIAALAVEDLIIHLPQKNAVFYLGETIPVRVETETFSTDNLNVFTCTVTAKGNSKTLWKKDSGPGEEIAAFKTSLNSKSLKVGSYRLRADLHAIYNSDENNIVHDCKETVTFSVRRLKAPTKPKAAAGKRKVTVSWKKADGAKKYEIYRSTKKKSGYKKIATTTNTKYENKKLKKGKHYYYKVRTLRGGVKSGFTKPVLSGKVK